MPCQNTESRTHAWPHLQSLSQRGSPQRAAPNKGTEPGVRPQQTIWPPAARNRYHQPNQASEVTML